MGRGSVGVVVHDGDVAGKRRGRAQNAGSRRRPPPRVWPPGRSGRPGVRPVRRRGGVPWLPNGGAEPGGMAPCRHAARGQGGGRRRARPPRPPLRLRRARTPRRRRGHRCAGAGPVRGAPRRRVRARARGGIRAPRAARLAGEGGLHRTGLAAGDRRAVSGRGRSLQRGAGRRPSPRRAAAARQGRSRGGPRGQPVGCRTWRGTSRGGGPCRRGGGPGLRVRCCPGSHEVGHGDQSLACEGDGGGLPSCRTRESALRGREG